jgi:hypothetical protein
MEILLILVLAVAVFAVWRSGRDNLNGLRAEIEAANRRIEFLSEQILALRKAEVASQPHAPTPAPAPESPKPSTAAHHAPPAVAAFKPADVPQPAAAVPPVAGLPTAQPPSPPSAPQPQPQPPAWLEPPPASKPAIPVRPAVLAQPRPESAAETPAQAAPAPRFYSMEERFGANWLNKLGIAILVIGLAFFLAYKLQNWGPAGKVLCGYAVSAALLAGGVWLERKPTYRIFARAGIGGGWALCFFVTFAMHHIPAARVLDSLSADLVLMLLVAAGMVAHSLRYGSQTVTGLAFLLGFLTLLTSNLQAASGTAVFSLTASAVLAIALVVVTTLRHWAWLELTGLIAVYASHFVWLEQVLPENRAAFADFWPSTVLILLYWLIFRLAYVFRTPLDAKEETISSLSAILNSTGVLGLLKLQSAHPEWAAGALAALGVAELALAFRARGRRHQAFLVLSTIASVLLLSAVPFRFHGVSWPVLWLVESQVLALAGLRLGEPVFRRLGLLAGIITGAVLFFRDLFPLFIFRLDSPDPHSHTSLIVALSLAAILYWLHAEVYPRRWPQIAAHEIEALALKITSWLAAGAAAAALWVALPDQWLPLGWLGLALALGFAGQRFQAPRPAVEGDALALASAAVLAFHHVIPLFLFRLDNADPTHHAAETSLLGIAALAFWIRAEVYPRILPPLIAASGSALEAWQPFVVPLISLLGIVTGAAALWVVLPIAWVAVGWLGLVFLLGLAADGLKALSLAVEADLLAFVSLVSIFPFTVWSATVGSGEGWRDHKAPLLCAVALFYAGMRRKTVPQGARNYVASAYSWAAIPVVLAAVSAIYSAPWIALVLAAYGFALFEIGRFARKGFLRWQGYVLTAAAFADFLIDDLVGPRSRAGSALVAACALATVGYLLLERTMNRERSTRAEHIVAMLADSLGTVTIALWFAERFPQYWTPARVGEVWVTPIWAAMATVLLALACLMRRRAFAVQAIALAIVAVLRGLVFDLFLESPAGFWNGPIFHLGIAALILLAALPFAFKMRGPEFWQGGSITAPRPFAAMLRRPEQWFFFAPFGLMVAALAIRLSSGHITIAWSLLGLAVFLFALAVGERSYRLAGLALLLLSVAKILLMDVWALSPPDRYTTLIVLGLALLAVSFLYTRFGSVIRKYL